MSKDKKPYDETDRFKDQDGVFKLPSRNVEHGIGAPLPKVIRKRPR